MQCWLYLAEGEELQANCTEGERTQGETDGAACDICRKGYFGTFLWEVLRPIFIIILGKCLGGGNLRETLVNMGGEFGGEALEDANLH